MADGLASPSTTAFNFSSMSRVFTFASPLTAPRRPDYEA